MTSYFYSHNIITHIVSAFSQKVHSIEHRLQAKRSKRAHLYEPPEGMPLSTVEEFEAFEMADEIKHDALVRYILFENLIC